MLPLLCPATVRVDLLVSAEWVDAARNKHSRWPAAALTLRPSLHVVYDPVLLCQLRAGCASPSRMKECGRLHVPTL